jgi:hypothetical protein
MDNEPMGENIRFVFSETKIASEPLNNKAVAFVSEDKKRVGATMGNTGLKYFYNQEDDGSHSSHFDFMPEDKIDFVPEKSGKYAVMLCAGLLGLRDWLKDDEQMNKYGINFENLPKLKALTNLKMINGLINLFERNGQHGELIETDDKKENVAIDLKSFVRLPEDDDLISYIRKVTERSKDTLITYTKEVDK